MNRSNNSISTCKICDKSYNNLCGLTSHIRYMHNMSCENYHNIYYDIIDKCCICGQKTKFHNLKQGYRSYCSKKCIAISITNASKLRNINEVFDISKNENIYLLGMLWADGNICPKTNKVNLEIMKTDYDDISFILNGWNLFMNHHHKKIMACCSVNNFQFHQLLKNSDYLYKKINSPTLILKQIPKELHFYFWRGYFDGDGCFYYGKKRSCRQAVFTSSFEQDWTEYENLLDGLKITSYRIMKITSKQKKKNGDFCKYSRLIITNKDSIKIFGDYIYQDEIFGLKRKLQKFQEMYITSE